MFLPIGDTPNPRMTPYVTWGLMAINILVFFLVTFPLSSTRPDPADPLLYEYMVTFSNGYHSLSDIARSVSAYDLVVFQYGFRPSDPSVVGLFSAMFLHGGFMHLAGNMLFLWIYGDNVEHRLGPLGFLLAYLGTGIAATLVFALFALDSPYPMIGASGAISGVLGSYFIWFPRNQVKTFVFLFPIFMHTILIPARWVLGFYIVIDNLLPFMVNGGSATGVAHGAHIGGFFAGLALAWGLDHHPHRHVKGQARKVSPSASAGSEKSRGSDMEALPGHVERGDFSAALAAYARLDRKQRQTLAASVYLQLGQILLDSGENFSALSLFRRFIAERPADPQIGLAYLGAGQAMLQQPRGATSAYHYFLSAIDSSRDPEVVARARGFLERLAANPKS